MIATPKTVKPDHVPDRLVVVFDALMDSGSDPSTRMPETTSALFETHGPILWSPYNGGHWFVGGYKAVFDMAQDTTTFSSDPRKYPPERNNPVVCPVNFDPPEHGVYRAPIVEAMSPKIINQMEQRIRQLAISLTNDYKAQGGGDVIDAILEPLPVVVFLQLLGLPIERLKEFRELSMRMLTTPEASERLVIRDTIVEILDAQIEKRIAKREDDLISRLLDSQVYGRALTRAEMLDYCVLLFGAGLDTVVNTLAYGMLHLARDAELQARIRQNPELIPAAVEELMRRYSIVQHWRYVMEDTLFHGVQFKKFDRILYCLPRANLDAEVFTYPLEVDFDRDKEPHIGFFVGPHRCVGSHLARLEMRIAYEEMLRAIPPFRLASDAKIIAKRGFTYGIESLPLIWS